MPNDKTSVFCVSGSPMAKAVFTHEVKQAGLASKFEIDSCGTAAYHVGEDPDHRTVQTCKKHGVPCTNTARKLANSDFEKFDWIFVMDESNLADVKARKPASSKSKVHLFGEFDPNGESIIQDPYYGGINGFEHNFEQVTRCSKAFLKHLGH